MRQGLADVIGLGTVVKTYGKTHSNIRKPNQIETSKNNLHSSSRGRQKDGIVLASQHKHVENSDPAHSGNSLAVAHKLITILDGRINQIKLSKTAPTSPYQNMSAHLVPEADSRQNTVISLPNTRSDDDTAANATARQMTALSVSMAS